MEAIRVSLIVPVYNVEKYLPACLDSALAQTLTAIEIICVDDGSTDASPRILADYAARDARITVVTRANGGLSAARNSGIDAARGEYLLFLDSDDQLAAPNAAEALYARARAGELDMLFFEARMRYETPELRASASEGPDFYVRRHDYPAAASGPELYRLLNRWDEYRPNAYLYLLRREFAEAAHLRFPEGVYHEDEVFTLAALGLARRASCIHLCGYERLWRAGSIMTEQGVSRRICGNLFAARAMLDFAAQRLSDVDAAFLRRYREHARAINVRGLRQYLELDRDARRAFLAALPAETVPVVRCQLRAAVGPWLARQARLTFKRLLPRDLWNSLRERKRR